MAKKRQLVTNFSKGELSPLIEGRPDLAAYFEGGSTIENFHIRRQGGLERSAGTRFIAEVKDSTKDTILLPFQFSVDDAYILEVGDLYIRIYKDKARIESGSPVEVVTPFAVDDIRSIHYTQSADVLFLFHGSHQQRRLSRVSDTSWTLSTLTADPPPTFEADTDLSGGTITLTPSATTGTGVNFTASAAAFLAGDVGRQIVFGASLAVIVSFTSTTVVVADIIDNFPNTSAIPAGSWLIRLSSQTTLDPTIKGPVGSVCGLVAGANAFRSADVGKYVHVYGGTIKITSFLSATSIWGVVKTVLSESTASNPAAAAAGAWTLEVASWSASRGWPRTGEFFQGRLSQASTASQPTTVWVSAADDFVNYARGVSAENAVEYPIATRQVNRLEWLADNISLNVGTSGAEMRLLGSGNDNVLISGDSVPYVETISQTRCAPIQPVTSSRTVLFIDRSLKRIFRLAYDADQGGSDAEELSVMAEHITGAGVKLGPLAFQRALDPRLYFVNIDGDLVTMTYFPKEKVVGFTRRRTAGLIEAVAVIPSVSGGDDQVWMIVRRTINGASKRYVEMAETNHEDLSSLATRSWTSLQTDSAVVYLGVATTTMTGLTHLEGETVQVVADGRYIGTKVVSSGTITLEAAATSIEAGLGYSSVVATMRPAIPGVVIDGLPRTWSKLFVRLYRSLGGTVNSEAIQYPGHPIDQPQLFTGDRDVTGDEGWSTDGRVTVRQDQPYPMSLVAVFGTLEVSDHD